MKPPPPRVVDPRTCESARVNWQNACGTPYSFRSRSPVCNEAYAIYRDSCG